MVRASLIAAGLSALVGSAPCLASQAVVVEMLAFDTNVVPGATTAAKPVRLAARLYLPMERSGPVAAMVITPSSGGLRVEREIFYAETLAGNGIAALVIDSFGPRGVAETSTDQTRVTLWQTENDAFAGLEQLVADPRIDPARIGVMGVSKGGGVALQSLFLVRQRWRRTGELAFAAHVPIVPPCNFVHRSMATTGKPVLFLLAELDDQTPAAPCQQLAEALRAHGHRDVVVKVYKGAYHAWERIGPGPFYNARAENYKNCRGVIEDDGALTMTATGERLALKDRWPWFKANCMTHGALCCGGTEALRDEAAEDLLVFLKQRGF